MSAPQQHDCYAVVAPGLEPLVSAELAALGLSPGAEEPGGVPFRADDAGVALANLHLRVASRVLVRVATFHAASFAELERRAARVPWERFVAPGTAVDFRVTSRKSRLYHQDAVAERLLRAVGAVGAVGTAAAGGEDDDGDALAQGFVVRLFRDRLTLSADSSGALLHRRGYRLATAKAPLRETLAAAMLLGVGWDGSTPLIDPLCGSGTVAIEAALIARRIAPGLRRSFAFERWPGYDLAAWERARSAAEAVVLDHSPVPILASDRDAGAVAAAEANAERAGVAGDVTVRRHALSAIEPPPGPGWLVTNPPYGARVGDRLGLRDLFAQLGNVARRRCPGWGIAFLSADPGLERQTGLELESRWAASNGGIRVRLAAGSLPRSEARSDRQ